jgi:predicted ATPase
MNRLVVEDVRCFKAVQPRIRPLTLLVGENSTGKTTFLSLLRLAWDLAAGQIDLDFNEDPFRLGAYDQIAHFHGGRGKRARQFKIGVAYGAGRAEARSRQAAMVEATFCADAGQPKAVTWRVVADGVDLVYHPGSRTQEAAIEGRLGQKEVAFSARWRGPTRSVWERLQLLFVEDMQPTKQGGRDWDRELRSIWQLFSRLRIPEPRPAACAPIRTGPQRTYDPIRETQLPSGGHVPMVLARLAASEPDQWERLAKALSDFGNACGLFRTVSVHRAKKEKTSEPFQIMVQIEGQRAPVNLVDVGYGVSQVLPVLVDSLLQRSGWFLLQQPEVHLHPRAQAELGSFLGTMVAAGRRFAVETHSDYLLDRVCMEVRKGETLKPSDVMILYFERSDSHVAVHEIEVDRQGNVLGAPPGYREFFRREQDRLLGIED